MPRIDPLQLLKCLSVLLSGEGGILSRDEVPRLVNLMTKFSKKLVSKCIYILILKNTETSLVDMFMAEGGWGLVQAWIQDAGQSKNWNLVKEVLQLLLVTPVDVERLKLNSLPKFVKNLSLSRKEELGEVPQLANEIVQKWLIIVKGPQPEPLALPPSEAQATASKEPESEVSEPIAEESVKEAVEQTANTSVEPQTIDPKSFYKNGSRKLSVDESKNSSEESVKSDDKEADKDKEKEKKKSKSSSSSSSRSKSSSSSSSRDKDKKKSSSSSRSSSCSSKSSKDKDKDRKDKDKYRSSSSKSSSKSSSSSSRDKKESSSREKSRSSSEPSKEKQADKDKDTLEKVKQPSLDKMGRIPKKSDDKPKENKSKEPEVKKPSFSILNRKTTEERGKTVKVFNAKMRSTGLEEEAKPPPPRSATKKPNPSVQLPTIPSKRPSPPREICASLVPPEKRIKIDSIDKIERPGAIKLIAPKPKPALIQESDMFMDALAASASKKDSKKRKRRPSVTKDAPASPTSSPSTSTVQNNAPPEPTSPTTSLGGLKNITPINFYQDTLSDEPEKEVEINGANDENEKNAEGNDALPDKVEDTPTSPTENKEPEFMETDPELIPPKVTMENTNIKGILVNTKRTAPKRSIKWRPEADLVEVKFFELDVNERINVTKIFGDVRMEMNHEGQLLRGGVKRPDDTQEPKIEWYPPYVGDMPEPLAAPGSKSLEKDIQFAREKASLAVYYFDRRQIPDSPAEPVLEVHQMSDPVLIPLHDPESQEIDLKGTPWPEPKGENKEEPKPTQMPSIFPNIPFQAPFNNIGNLPPAVPFAGMPPGFPGSMGVQVSNFASANMMPNNMMPMNQPEMMMNQGPMMNQSPMNQGPMNQNPYGSIPGSDAFIGPGNDPNFQPMQQYNGQQNQNMNSYVPNNNYNNHYEGPRRGRGGFRGRGNGGWVPMNGPRHWNRGGGGHRGGRLCKNIQNHGYCRNLENCPFVH